MRQSKRKKRVSRKYKLRALQVQEYTERYHPDLMDAAVDISPSGTLAMVREAPKICHEQ